MYTKINLVYKDCMKRIIVMLIALFIMIYPVSSFANLINAEEKNYTGAVFMKNLNDELVQEATITNIK